jgi:DNA-directed RNA polymerase subunit H (RpoH/RPB5)
MSAFTEEQQAILREAFHHVWRRMESLHDDLNEDSLRVATALHVLVEHGVLSEEELDRVMARLHVEANQEQLGQEADPVPVTEEQTTAAILGGDLDAFHRREAAEEEEN